VNDQSGPVRLGVAVDPEVAGGADRARRIIETARDAFISIDDDGLVQEWNRAAELLFGWPAEQAIGQRLDAMIIPAAQRGWHREGLARMKAGGDAHILERTLELTALRRDLSEVLVELTVWSVDDDRRSFSAFVRDISERRAHEAIRARLASVVEFSSDAILTLDPDGVVLSWNAGAEMIYGYTAGQMVGQNAASVLSPPVQRSDREQVRERLGQGEASHRELRLVRADGQPVMVSVTSSPILDADGKLVAVSSISRDITRAKEIEQALQESEERYRLLVDLSTDLITTVSPETGVILYASASVTSMLGWAPQDLVGRRLGEFVPTESGSTQAEAVMLAGDQVHVRTLQLRRRDGSLLWCEASSRSIVNPRTGAGEILSTIRDVSARVAAQDALAASEERFRLTQLHAPTGLALIGLDGRYLQVNPALCTLAGRSEEELMSLTFQDITHPDDLPRDLDLLDRLARGEIQGYELEKRYLHPDGAIVWVLLSRSLVRLGSEPHFITQVLDISSRKRDEAALAAANTELEELNRRLSLLSVTDPLTEAFNRRHLDTVLARTCHDAERHGDHTAVLLIDVDHFKHVNDQLGHHRGDEVLKHIADRLASTLRSHDTLGRWGGEEFLILLPRTDQQGAEALAERVRSSIADEPLRDHEEALNITVSIGVAAGAVTDPVQLLSRADRALYRAKAAGRNRIAAG